MSAYPIPASPPPARLTSIAGGRVSERPADYETNGERYVRLPVALMAHPAVSAPAAMCYAWLSQHDGERGCFPSFETLAGELRCSERSVKTYVAELEASGFLSHRRGGRDTPNRYTLHPAGDGPDRADRVQPDSPRATDRVQPAAPYEGKGAKSRTDRVQNPAKKREADCTVTRPKNKTQLTTAPTERCAAAPATERSTRGESAEDAEALAPSKAPFPPKAAKPPPATDAAFALVDRLYRAQNVKPPDGYDRRDEAKAADELIALCGDDALAWDYLDARRQGRRQLLRVRYALNDAKAAQMNGATDAATKQPSAAARRVHPAGGNGRVHGGAGGLAPPKVPSPEQQRRLDLQAAVAAAHPELFNRHPDDPL